MKMEDVADAFRRRDTPNSRGYQPTVVTLPDGDALRFALWRRKSFGVNHTKRDLNNLFVVRSHEPPERKTHQVCMQWREPLTNRVVGPAEASTYLVVVGLGFAPVGDVIPNALRGREVVVGLSGPRIQDQPGSDIIGP